MKSEGNTPSFDSRKILNDNIEWLLYSDIRIKTGSNKGALYGWKNFTAPYFPFIYSEITGYAISCYCWIASEFGNAIAIEAAIDASEWIRKNMHSHLLAARPPANPDQPNELSSLFYSFDNSMVMIGLINLYKLTKKSKILRLAVKTAQALVERFFDGEKLNPRLDKSFKSIKPTQDGGVVKWSTIPGAYHCKISLGLLELSNLTGNREFVRVSNRLCEYAKKIQKSNGQFITNPGSEIVYLHPHLYACEGLIYSGLKQSNESHYAAGLEGVKWAMNQLDPNSNRGLFSITPKGSVEQSDCTAQLLRLLVLCRFDLETTVNKVKLIKVINRLHYRLLDFYIPAGEDRGGMKYQFSKNTACSWCTMFSVQAFRLWSNLQRNSNLTWIEHFV
jgi:hypothetical protein